MKTFFKFFLTLIITYSVFPGCFYTGLQAQPAFPNDSLVKILDSPVHDTVKLEVLFQLCLYFQNRDLDQCSKYASTALLIAENLHRIKAMAEAYRNLGVVDHRRGNFEKAIEQFRKGLAIFIQANDSAGRASVMSNLASSFFGLGQLDSAMFYNSKALFYFEFLKNMKGQSSCYNNMGGIYWNKGNYAEAVRMFFKSLKIKEQLGDSLGMANSYNNVGIIFDSQKKYVDALDNYQHALHIYRNLGVNRGIANACNNIGVIYKNTGEYLKALGMYKQSLEREQIIGNPNGEAYTYSNIGEVYFMIHQYDEALNYYIKALKLFESTDDQKGRSGCLTSLGNTYNKMGMYKKAIGLFTQNLETVEKLGFNELKRDLYKGLYNAYKKIGNPTIALNYHEKYTALNDTLLNETNNKQISELKIAYETDKKEAEIKILNQNNQYNEIVIRRKTFETRVLIGFACLLLLMAGFIFYLYKLKKTANKILQSKNSEIAQQRDNLELLYQELVQQKEEIIVQRDEIDHQRNIINYRNKSIMESIRYAQTIQNAILPREDTLKNFAADVFIFYQPKDIVSGDFYWIDLRAKTMFIAAIDCTGHGVPGALMTVVAFNLLNQAFYEVEDPTPVSVLNFINFQFSRYYQKQDSNNILSEGIEILIGAFHLPRYKFTYTGNGSSFLWIGKKGPEKIKTKRVPFGNKSSLAEEKCIDLDPGDKLYFFSDGFADQFGGMKYKKFMNSNFMQLLVSNQMLPMKEQKSLLEKAFQDWKGSNDQVDDVMVIGIQI